MRIQRSLSGRLDVRQAENRCAGFRKCDQLGFSLIELLVSIAIMGIILAIALPTFSDWRERAAAKTAADTLAAHLKQARLMAISENRSVTVALAADSYTIDSTGSAPLLISLTEYSPNLTLTYTGAATFSFGSAGTSAAKTITINNASGKNWVITVNVVGRVSIQ